MEEKNNVQVVLDVIYAEVRNNLDREAFSDVGEELLEVGRFTESGYTPEQMWDILEECNVDMDVISQAFQEQFGLDKKTADFSAVNMVVEVIIDGNAFLDPAPTATPVPTIVPTVTPEPELTVTPSPVEEIEDEEVPLGEADRPETEIETDTDIVDGTYTEIVETDVPLGGKSSKEDGLPTELVIVGWLLLLLIAAIIIGRTIKKKLEKNKENESDSKDK